jgi:hypothetical protein
MKDKLMELCKDEFSSNGDCVLFVPCGKTCRRKPHSEEAQKRFDEYNESCQ